MRTSKLRGAVLFLAGAAFTSGLLLTCTGGTSSMFDGGQTGIAGDAARVQAGGDAKAAPGGAVWEYAMASGVRAVGPTDLNLPNGSVQMVDCGSDPLAPTPPRSAIDLELCFLNKVGADGWELVQAQYLSGSHAGFIFRRPK